MTAWTGEQPCSVSQALARLSAAVVVQTVLGAVQLAVGQAAVVVDHRDDVDRPRAARAMPAAAVAGHPNARARRTSAAASCRCAATPPAATTRTAVSSGAAPTAAAWSSHDDATLSRSSSGDSRPSPPTWPGRDWSFPWRAGSAAQPPRSAPMGRTAAAAAEPSDKTSSCAQSRSPPTNDATTGAPSPAPRRGRPRPPSTSTPTRPT